MTIHINQTPVLFTLDGERTLSDLSASLNRWAVAEDYVVVSLLADGKAFDGEEHLSLDHVGLVEVETVPKALLPQRQLDFILGYLNLVVRAVEGGNTELASDLRTEVGPVLQTLSQLLAPLSPETDEALRTLQVEWNPEALALLVRVTENRAAEHADPVAAVSAAATALSEELDAAAELPTLFQHGHDRKAFDLILSLFTALGDLDRTVPLICRDSSSRSGWNAFRSELAPFLTESRAALDSGDYVLLTDLMEYEVGPRLRTLQDLLSSIINLDPVPGLL